MFVGGDGKSLFFTFALVSSLFLLWGFCNGMIDVMDKHFQEANILTFTGLYRRLKIFPILKRMR